MKTKNKKPKIIQMSHTICPNLQRQYRHETVVLLDNGNMYKNSNKGWKAMKLPGECLTR